MLIMIHTLVKVEDRETNEMDLSHNCSQHGGKSEVCENYRSCMWMIKCNTFANERTNERKEFSIFCNIHVLFIWYTNIQFYNIWSYYLPYRDFRLFWISGWRLVFRSTAGTGVSIYPTWTSPGGLNDEDCALWNTDSSVPGVMKSDMIDNWQSISPPNVNILYAMGWMVLVIKHEH